MLVKTFLYVGEITNIKFDTYSPTYFSPTSRRSWSCMLVEVFRHHTFFSNIHFSQTSFANIRTDFWSTSEPCTFLNENFGIWYRRANHAFDPLPRRCTQCVVCRKTFFWSICQASNQEQNFRYNWKRSKSNSGLSSVIYSLYYIDFILLLLHIQCLTSGSKVGFRSRVITWSTSHVDQKHSLE